MLEFERDFGKELEREAEVIYAAVVVLTVYNV